MQRGKRATAGAGAANAPVGATIRTRPTRRRACSPMVANNRQTSMPRNRSRWRRVSCVRDCLHCRSHPDVFGENVPEPATMTLLRLLKMLARGILSTPTLAAIFVAAGVVGALAMLVLPSSSESERQEPVGTVIAAPTDLALDPTPAPDLADRNAVSGGDRPTDVVPSPTPRMIKLPTATATPRGAGPTPTPRVVAIAMPIERPSPTPTAVADAPTDLVGIPVQTAPPLVEPLPQQPPPAAPPPADPPPPSAPPPAPPPPEVPTAAPSATAAPTVAPTPTPAPHIRERPTPQPDPDSAEPPRPTRVAGPAPTDGPVARPADDPGAEPTARPRRVQREDRSGPTAMPTESPNSGDGEPRSPRDRRQDRRGRDG